MNYCLDNTMHRSFFGHIASTYALYDSEGGHCDVPREAL